MSYFASLSNFKASVLLANQCCLISVVSQRIFNIFYGITLHNVCVVHRDIMSTVGDTMNTPGGVQYTGGYQEYNEGYHEYTEGCSVHWGIP